MGVEKTKTEKRKTLQILKTEKLKALKTGKFVLAASQSRRAFHSSGRKLYNLQFLKAKLYSKFIANY